MLTPARPTAHASDHPPADVYHFNNQSFRLENLVTENLVNNRKSTSDLLEENRCKEKEEKNQLKIKFNLDPKRSCTVYCYHLLSNCADLSWTRAK